MRPRHRGRCPPADAAIDRQAASRVDQQPEAVPLQPPDGKRRIVRRGKEAHARPRPIFRQILRHTGNSHELALRRIEDQQLHHDPPSRFLCVLPGKLILKRLPRRAPRCGVRVVPDQRGQRLNALLRCAVAVGVNGACLHNAGLRKYGRLMTAQDQRGDTQSRRNDERGGKQRRRHSPPVTLPLHLPPPFSA